MSNHYNALTDLRNTLQETMKSCWQQGTKCLIDSPHDAEIYFTVGETCQELIKLIKIKQQEEIELWRM